MHYEECVQKLICDLGFKGRASIDVFMGRITWEALSRVNRRNLSRVMDREDIPHMIVKVQDRQHILLLGVEKCHVAFHLNVITKQRQITRQQRHDFLRRLAKNEFPEPGNSFEAALEFDALA